MSAQLIVTNPEVKKLSSDELKKKVLNYREDNAYLEKLVSDTAEKQLLIEQGTLFLSNIN